MNPHLSADGKHLLYETPHSYRTTSREQLHELMLHALERCCLLVCDDTDQLLTKFLPILQSMEWSADVRFLRKVSANIGMRVMYEEQTSDKPRNSASAELREMKARYDAVISDWEARKQ